MIYLPNQVQGKVPLFLGFNFNGNFATTDETDLPIPTHFVNSALSKSIGNRPAAAQRGHDRALWPYDEILSRGYAVATAAYGEVEPDMANQWWHGPRVLSPPKDANDWGALGSWAWAMSHALDYLETNERVDSKRVALLGFSRIGKAAMWAAAQDERFAMTISQHWGKAGASLSQHPVGEPIANLVGRLGHWFAPNYAKYVGKEAELPVDAHCLAALIAPRPLLILSATKDTWSDPEGGFLSGAAATPVYRLLGQTGLSETQWPAPQVLAGGTIGYYLRSGGHDVTAEEWRITLQFADKYLRAH